ncbi:MAG: hypothetical protein P8N09_06535 [Planctomycetota bacterium]|nr:hypothetical protein [Planctomycetota bacterium]
MGRILVSGGGGRSLNPAVEDLVLSWAAPLEEGVGRVGLSFPVDIPLASRNAGLTEKARRVGLGHDVCS